ncbi:unnamed protein product [marine sediment metagenome]|uniref:Uncharacterized protein n=1 Tax=marine sediment metagenome TaxID=412755 RepID=X1R8S1_9ZZZZ
MYLRYFGYIVEYYNDIYKFVVEMDSKGYFESDFSDYYTGVLRCYSKLFGIESKEPIKPIYTL